jgi:hypothetical protein
MSNLLVAVLLPLASWGLLASLLLQLIALRGSLIEGGATKLRMATLAFALGVVLIQRLGVQQGRSVARAYGLALGGSMMLFAAVDALSWRVPAPPAMVFAGNCLLLGILWWAGHKITAACAVDGETARLAAETGILGRRRRQEAAAGELQPIMPIDEPEAEENRAAPMDVRAIYDAHQTSQRLAREASRRRTAAKSEDAAGQADWSRRLGGTHPGRVLLYFGLVAVPVFGLGAAAMVGDPVAQMLGGIRLFLYLWCTLTLLWLASLGQLHAYFEQRAVNLPEVVGLNWIGIGSTVTLVALAAAFLLPQPPSPGTFYVRQRIRAVYRGWEANSGMREEGTRRGTGDDAGKTNGNDRRPAAERFHDWDRQRYEHIDRMGDKMLSETARSSGIEPDARNVKALGMVMEQTAGKLFDVFLRLLFVLLGVAVLAALYALVAFGASGLREGWRGLRLTLKPRTSKKRRVADRERREAPAGAHFAAFANPFLGASELRDGDALVRYLWAATLALCADHGVPCPPGATPREFVAGRPEPLAGLEDQAHWLADLLCFSEFSGQPISTSERPRLQSYWQDLQHQAVTAT